MFVAVQISIADLRPFIGEETGRVPLPGWPNPQVDVEFVRDCGPVRERRRGGLEPWTGEGSYANAARAMRFEPGFDGWARVGRGPSMPLRCIYRRLYSDGRAIMRTEVGFGIQRGRRPPDWIPPAEILPIVDRCLTIPTRIPAEDGKFKTRELALVGGALARCLLRATTLKGVTPESRWMRPVRPMAVVMVGPDDLRSLTSLTRTVSLGEDAPTVLHRVFEIGGITVPVWFLPREDPRGPEVLRRIRMHLFRLHAEREVLKSVLSAAAAGQLAKADHLEPSDALQQYLMDTLSLLGRGSIYNIGPTEDLRATLRLADLVNPGERSSLLAQLNGVRGNILRAVERAPINQKLQPTTYYDQRTYNAGGDLKVTEGTDNSTNVQAGGNIQGSNFGIGNTLIAESMTQVNSSGASDELKVTLTELGDVVKAMGEQIAADNPDLADGAARDVKAMVDEATSPSPRKGTIERIGDGLLATAKTVGEVGLPVIKVVAKLIALFA